MGQPNRDNRHAMTGTTETYIHGAGPNLRADSNSGSESLLNDSRVTRASREFLESLEAGRTPDRTRYYDRDPELRGVLSELFDGIELALSLQLKPTVPGAELAEPLGDFRLLREIGRGGMGVVYEATQLSLGRKVAIKVLPFSAALDERQRRRFQIEAQAAALLHHPNIVPVFAVGCERGLHFYAMQLIDGGSLAGLISECQQESTGIKPSTTPSVGEALLLRDTLRAAGDATRTPFSRLSARSISPSTSRPHFRAMAILMVQAADALEYAHRAGTIHRDIKPANLLVDHSGNLWITDFGLAQVASDVNLTLTGDVLGTLRYMSPEQAGGHRVVLDGRTDLYSLGATFYELLTLRPVFDGSDRHGLLRRILETDPVPPRQLNREIPVELETIILKCLSKSPQERYASAADVATDIRRFLEERPILARRPSWWEIARKWLRRHPSIVAAFAVVSLCGAIGLGVTTAVVMRALEREQTRFQLAKRAADDMITVAQQELSRAPFQDGPRKRLLESALAYYQEFIELSHDRPEAQSELARTRDNIARILEDLKLLEVGRNNLLLREPAVLDDLGLTGEARLRIEERCSQVEADLAKLFTESAEHPREFLGHSLFRLAGRANLDFAALLTSEQSARLKQIALQWEGPRVFFDHAVAKELELTAEQLQQIREVEQHLVFQVQQIAAVTGNFVGIVPPNRTMIQQGMEQVLDKLTPAQRSRWESLTGRPYTGPIGLPGGIGGLPIPVPQNK